MVHDFIVFCPYILGSGLFVSWCMFVNCVLVAGVCVLCYLFLLVFLFRQRACYKRARDKGVCRNMARTVDCRTTVNCRTMV